MSVKTRKVGIVTLPGYFNYGNRLQNYALQEQIKELGYKVDTLVFPSAKSTFIVTESKLQKARRISKLTCTEIGEKIRGKFQRRYKGWVDYLNRGSITERDRIFKEFSAEYLSEKFFDNSKDVLDSIGDDYDYFVTGSDQVWNPHFIQGLEKIYFLNFAEKRKRISYAASFGIIDLPDEYSRKIKPFLSEMEAVSVREETGAKIVKDISGRDAVVLVDPTLLLSREKWLSIAKEAEGKPQTKYVLSYFLGEKNPETLHLIKTVADKKGLQIVRLSDYKDKNAYRTGPSEFIDYVNSAEAVFTDSFHGVVFSVLMGVPFVACKRLGKYPMYSRIETLLSILDLKNREEINIKGPEDVWEINFSHIHPQIKIERGKATGFLRQAFKER